MSGALYWVVYVCMSYMCYMRYSKKIAMAATDAPYSVVFFTTDQAVTYLHTTRLCGTVKPKAYWPAAGGRVDQKMLAGQFDFQQRGESGQWISELLPHFSQVADKACVIRSINTFCFPGTYAIFVLVRLLIYCIECA